MNIELIDLMLQYQEKTKRPVIVYSQEFVENKWVVRYSCQSFENWIKELILEEVGKEFRSIAEVMEVELRKI